MTEQSQYAGRWVKNKHSGVVFTMNQFLDPEPLLDPKGQTVRPGNSNMIECDKDGNVLDQSKAAEDVSTLTIQERVAKIRTKEEMVEFGMANGGIDFEAGMKLKDMKEGFLKTRREQMIQAGRDPDS